MTPYDRERARPLLLVVDDDEMQRYLCRECLDSHFDVVEATEGRMAVTRFLVDRPDLVLLDVMMPDIDGYATCRTLRALPGGGTVPILMATGLDDLASIDAAYAAGATDFVAKPINWGLLPHRIKYLLRSHETLQNFIVSERRLETAQRIATMGDFLWSPGTPSVRLSAEAAQIFGYRDDTVAVSLGALLRRIPVGDRTPVLRALRGLEREQTVEIDHRIVRLDGAIRHISLRAELGRDAGGAPALQATCHDITERKKIELELRQARDEARSADAAKTAFLAVMSHELQTPLNAIIGFAELLAASDAPGGSPSERNLVFSRCILEAGRRMSASIDEVLLLARLESGAWHPLIEPLDLGELVEATVSDFRRTAAAAGRTIQMTTATGAAVAAIDERAVRRMVGNLLSNALKFSAAEASVAVRVDRAPDGHYRVAVEDRGIGMDGEQVAAAVRAFRQLDAGLAREFSGMGLGLSITSRLIAAHGGELELLSTPGQGTRAILHFPCSAGRSMSGTAGFADLRLAAGA